MATLPPAAHSGSPYCAARPVLCAPSECRRRRPTRPTERRLLLLRGRRRYVRGSSLLSLSLVVAAACERMQPAAPPPLDIINTLAVLSSAAHTRRLALVCSSLLFAHNTRARDSLASVSLSRWLACWLCARNKYTTGQVKARRHLGMPIIVKWSNYFLVFC